MERYYQFAGVDYRISLPEELPFSELESLAQFRSDPLPDPHVFRFSLRETLDPPDGPLLSDDGGFREYGEGDVRIRFIGTIRNSWSDGYIRAEHRGNMHDVQLRRDCYPEKIGSRTILQTLWPEHLIAQKGGFVFHCSFIERKGKAILFTAPSETGKSTQAELWKQHRGAEIINGDRGAVRCTDAGIFACGIPYSGSSSYCKQRTLPLECIVYLSQAPSTSIRRLRGYEAFSRIWEGCSINTWEREDMALVSDAVGKVAVSVPVYHLACTPDESAVIALEYALGKQENR